MGNEKKKKTSLVKRHSRNKGDASPRPRRKSLQFLDIISYLPDPTLVIDAEGRVVAFNKAMEELTGIKEKHIIGKGNYEYAVPFYGERRPMLIDLALRTKR